MDREQRIARNESAYRDVNEAIRTGRPDDDGPSNAFMCECGRLGCNALIELRLAEYEAVRANPRRFVMVGGHEIPDVETVVERLDGCVVVEKREEAARVAEELDPRDG